MIWELSGKTGVGETTHIEMWREGPRQDPEKQPYLVDRWQRRSLHRGMSGGLTGEGRSVSRWKEGDPVTGQWPRHLDLAAQRAADCRWLRRKQRK